VITLRNRSRCQRRGRVTDFDNPAPRVWLGKPVTYSVRCDNYSGGRSIDITVGNWPEAWQDCDGYAPGSGDRLSGRGRELCRDYFCAAALALTGQTRPGAQTHQVLTEEAQAAKMTLERIHGAYNHDGSDIQSDYFDVNYYGSVGFEDARSAEFRQREAVRKAARRHTIDAAAAAETKRVIVWGRGGKRTVHDAVDVNGRIKLLCGAQLWSYLLRHRRRRSRAELLALYEESATMMSDRTSTGYWVITVDRATGKATPVLVIGAECDRIVPSGVVRQTAARYQHSTCVEIPGSDHMVFSGAALPVTMGHIDDWIARNHVRAMA